MATLLIAGGAGFIGSNLVRYALAHAADRIVVVDKLTYAGSLLNLDGVLDDARVRFVHADIADGRAMAALFEEARPDAVMNLAAETHVDRSIDSPRSFIDSNIVGAFVLLETARQYTRALAPAAREQFRFLQISTDEVYGSLDSDGRFVEGSPYAPSSPYAASKAAADHLCLAYWRSYGVPIIVTNASNNYGPYQYPEKLIPLMILNAVDGRDLPIYGDGGNVRDWIHVEDHCAALLLVLARGRLGEKYNVGASNERTNLEVVDAVCQAIDAILPAAANPALAARRAASYRDLKRFVADRPGHDRRYAIDSSKIARELGWSSHHRFDQGMVETVRWYLDHRAWCEHVQAGRYDRERLGLS